MLGLIGAMVVAIVASPDYNQTYFVILPGLTLTIVTTIVAFVIATMIGPKMIIIAGCALRI